MSALSKSFFTPLLAVDRLNSWVRASDAGEWPLRSVIRPVVYWVKTQAILRASKEWTCQFRRVQVIVKCNRCGGDGIYYGWWWMPGDKGETCRGCAGFGKARLRFIESTIGTIRWHTPIEKWYSSSLDVYVPFPSGYHPRLEDFQDTDWRPNAPGRRLSADEVLRDCRILLAAYPREFNFIVQYHYFPNTGRTWAEADKWLEELFARRKRAA
jgi:hypothetical protein